MVSFPDIPEALTCGDTFEEALTEAEGALVTAFEFYFEDVRAIPMPSEPVPGGAVVEVPISVWAKVLLLNAMVSSQISQAELARRIGVPRQQIQRLIDLRYTTKIDTLAAAIAATGRRLELIMH